MLRVPAVPAALRARVLPRAAPGTPAGGAALIGMGTRPGRAGHGSARSGDVAALVREHPAMQRATAADLPPTLVRSRPKRRAPPARPRPGPDVARLPARRRPARPPLRSASARWPPVSWAPVSWGRRRPGGRPASPAPHPRPSPPAAGGSAAPPERIGPPITGGQGSGQGPAAPGGSLSQQLQQGQGVIQPPPGIDPQMRQKAARHRRGAPAVIPPPRHAAEPARRAAAIGPNAAWAVPSISVSVDRPRPSRWRIGPRTRSSARPARLPAHGRRS